ncbi:MAG: hypothetical protein R2839_12260 [Thermomicrobiales bacterium]
MTSRMLLDIEAPERRFSDPPMTQALEMMVPELPPGWLELRYCEYAQPLVPPSNRRVSILRRASHTHLRAAWHDHQNAARHRGA